MDVINYITENALCLGITLGLIGGFLYLVHFAIFHRKTPSDS